MPKIKFSLPILLIIILAVFLRLFNLFGNFAIDGDSGRDVMIAHEAIRRGEIPLTGPFTSAGPFVFGPAFFWFVITSYKLLPFGLYSPWVLMFAAAIAFVLVMMAIGYRLGGRKLSVIIGLLAATSPQMVLRSKALTQHTLIAITAALAILCFILLWQKKKAIYAFLTGLSVGFALSLHYQSINLLLFLPVVLVIPKVSIKTKVFYLFLAFVGFLLPSLPLLIWDSRQNFANLNNILDYFLIGQYRRYVPASWKLFLFQQFPDYVNLVVGGIFPAGLILFWGTIITGLLTVRKKIQSAGPLLALVGIYFVLLFINRYYRGERFEGYLIYFVPFILLLSAILLEKLGMFVLAVIVLLNIWSSTRLLVNNRFNFLTIKNDAREIWTSRNYQKLSLYQNNDNSAVVAYPLYLALQNDHAVGQKETMSLGVLLDSSPRGYFLVGIANSNLSSDPQSWKELSDRAVYDDLMGWLQKNQLQSSFSLEKYIKERLP